MQAIKVQIYFSEWEKVSDFISEINIDEEMAAYAIDNRTMVIATVGECSMAYAKAQLGSAGRASPSPTALRYTQRKIRI